MSGDPDYLPGDAIPTVVPPEPPGVFRVDMHTRRGGVVAGWAPSLDPGRIGLYSCDDGYYPPALASITPSNARKLAENLLSLANIIEPPHMENAHGP